MKSSLALLVFCVVLALVSNTQAGKGGDWGTVMKGKCKGFFEGMKACKDKGKEGADGDDDDNMDNEGDGGAGDGGKKGDKGWKGKDGWKKKIGCFMKDKGILSNDKFRASKLKAEITSTLSDQYDTATAINKRFDKCATEKKIADLDFSEGNKDSKKTLFKCVKKSLKSCREDA